MAGIDQFLVFLWFLPVVFFIILPLFIACFGALYSILSEFKPVAGQQRKPIKKVTGPRVTTAA
ncbi:hypothetical protein ACFL0S_00765 [Thermodesulfobacteriota bacterium]